MKNCKKCGARKDLSCFYKHKGMKDGHLNICKDCIKNRVRSKYQSDKLDPKYVDKERARGREKYHRLYKDLKLSEKQRIQRKVYKKKVLR